MNETLSGSSSGGIGEMPVMSKSLTKDKQDTKGPADPGQKCWSSYERISSMMDELKQANVNILTFVHWGAYDETLEVNKPYNWEALPEGKEGITDNFLKVFSAATMPETCNHVLDFDRDFCIKYELGTKFVFPPAPVMVAETKRIIVDCECNTGFNPDDSGEDAGDRVHCSEGKYCFYGSCVSKDCGNCGNSEACCSNQQECGELYNRCVPVSIIDRPFFFHYFRTESCVEIFETTDSVQQLFEAAEEKDILVVPTLEPSVAHMTDFQYDIEPLKNVINDLLEKYGNNPNWLQIYDKTGNPRKAIHISQAIGLPAGTYTDGHGNEHNINENSYKTSLESLSLYFKQMGHNIGFLLDITAMPADYVLKDWFFPDAPYLSELKNLLGISVFGLPFNQHIQIEDNVLSWYSGDSYVMPIEKHFISRAKIWLESWKESGIPVIPDVIPGYDDRWRSQGFPSGFNIFGDNYTWQQEFAYLVFMYNTAGINLTIWNGYGEGYVWVPYRKRRFERPSHAVYTIDPLYQSGELKIPDSFLDLNLSVDENNNPVYEDRVIYDNYRYAMYLFSAQDSDGDGIPDYFDNCPQVKNPMVLNNSEIVAAPCENGIGGAACMKDTRKYVYRGSSGNYWWQPDHDLDGKGDACDQGSVWSSFRGVPLNIEKSVRDREKSNNIFTYYDIYSNDMLDVSINMNSAFSDSSVYDSTNRFCWLTPDEYNENKWGTEGKCTTEAKFKPQECVTDFGYSHGSDPKPVNSEGVPYWKKATLDKVKEFAGIKGGNTKSLSWNWRQDFIDDNSSPDIVSKLSKAPFCKVYNEMDGICVESLTEILSFYYSLSTGVKGDGVEYIIENPDPVLGNANINPSYFRNEQRYARTVRLSKDPVEAAYFYYSRSSPNDQGEVYCLGVPCNSPLDELRRKFFMDTVKEIVTGPDIFGISGVEHLFKNGYGSNLSGNAVFLGEWSTEMSGNPSVTFAAKPQFLATVAKNMSGVNAGINFIPQTGMKMLNSGTDGNLTGYSYTLVEMDKHSAGSWRTTGILDNVPLNFNPSASVYHNDVLFTVSREETSSSVIRKIFAVIPFELGGNTCTGTFNIFTPVYIDTVESLSNITLHSFSGGILILGEGGNGMEVHKLTEEHGDYSIENITGNEMPSIRDIYTADIKDGVLYLAGGIKVEREHTDLKTDFWKFSESEGWTLVRNDLNLFPASLRIDFYGDDVILTNRIFSYDAVTERVRFKVDGTGGTPVVETVKVEGVPVISLDQEFCIYEKSGSIFAGSTGNNGKCIPVYNYNYQTVSYLDYKKTVAGHKNNLYLGGLTGVRRVEIREDGSLVNRDMLYTGETNNLAVYGNTMYGANYGEIDVYSIADNGSISRTRGISSSSCGNVRVYDDKLFTAENKRVRVFDLTNPQNPQLIKTISTSGKVIDLEVVGEKLYIYEETTSWFTTKGFTGIYDISDITSPVRTKYFEKRCTDAEMQKSEYTIYLGCKNGQHRIEETGLVSVNGEKNYVREGYIHEKILYQVFSGFLHKSKTAVRIAVCGNGIVENDEMCDSDTIQCTELDSSYIGGTAACNSNCNGYNESVCEESDGW